MQTNSIRRLCRALASSLACLALATAGVHAQELDLEAIWSDPVLQKQFVAGYGVNAEIEPRMSPEEVKLMEELRPLMAGDPAKAEETLKKKMKSDGSAVLDFTLGALQFQQDELPEALQNYQRAVTKFPSFQRAWRNIAWLETKRGNYANAIHAFTRMIELGGADAYSYGLLGFAYTSTNDFQPAEASYRNALLLQPDNTEWRLGLTNCVLKQQKFADAVSLLDVLIARHPDKHQFWLQQAQAYIGLKEPLHAAENLEAVDRLGKSTPDSLHTLGDIYVTENLLDLATRAYLRAIERDAAQPIARPLRACEMLSSRGGNAQARRVTAAIQQHMGARLEEGDRRKLLKLEARFSMAEGGGSSETAAVLEEIVKLDPLDGDALMLLGHHWRLQNEPDRAILYYERAASIEAFEAGAKTWHAQVLMRMNRHAEALPLLRRAQELKPREDVARLIELVERNARAKR